MKERALHLLTEGWELPEIADVLGVSLKSIDRWADNYDRNGTVIRPSYHQGRCHLLNAEAISDLKELIDESPELYLDEIGEWFPFTMTSLCPPRPFTITCVILDSLKKSCVDKLPSVIMHYVLPGYMMSSACTLQNKWLLSMKQARSGRLLFESTAVQQGDMTLSTMSHSTEVSVIAPYQRLP